jgi:hypothetical protein
MTGKQRLKAIHNLLKASAPLLTVMRLSEQYIADKDKREQAISRRISRTLKFSNVASHDPLMAIYESAPTDSGNPRVLTHTLCVDVIVSLDEQQSKGIALDLEEHVKNALTGRLIGTGIRYKDTIYDRKTAAGWYKLTVRFNYNNIK